MNSRVLFLDYDGVVNISMWNERGTKRSFGYPEDGKVNHFQAVQWVSEFCERCHYDIVVTSTWRKYGNYKECLISGGLRKGIEILGKTEDLSAVGGKRGDEIKLYLDTHPEIKYYIIADDIDEVLPEQREHFVQTQIEYGFCEKEMNLCVDIYMKDKGRGGSIPGKEKL